jgi:hypothetical protein
MAVAFWLPSSMKITMGAEFQRSFVYLFSLQLIYGSLSNGCQSGIHCFFDGGRCRGHHYDRFSSGQDR